MLSQSKYMFFFKYIKYKFSFNNKIKIIHDNNLKIRFFLNNVKKYNKKLVVRQIH